MFGSKFVLNKDEASGCLGIGSGEAVATRAGRPRARVFRIARRVAPLHGWRATFLSF